MAAMATASPMSASLRVFGETIVPRPNISVAGHEVMDRVVRAITQKSKTKVSRVLKGGSMGKKTAILLKIDFDIVLFIDESVCSIGDYANLLDDINDIITLNFDPEFIYSTQNAVRQSYLILIAIIVTSHAYIITCR